MCGFCYFVVLFYDCFVIVLLLYYPCVRDCLHVTLDIFLNFVFAQCVVLFSALRIPEIPELSCFYIKASKCQCSSDYYWCLLVIGPHRLYLTQIKFIFNCTQILGLFFLRACKH